MWVGAQTFIVLAVIGGIACSSPTDESDPTETPIIPAELYGRYELVAIDGGGLPVALPFKPAPRYTVKADTLWLRSDGTYEERVARWVIGPAPLTLEGTFRIDGARVLLTGPGDVSDTARLQGLTLTVQRGSSGPWSFTRQCLGDTC
jgi:hypothetical protein